jgi:hypothetical protein
MRSRLVRRSAQLIADFVIGSLLPDHQTAIAFATNHSIPVDDGDSACWARARDCLAERSICDTRAPQERVPVAGRRILPVVATHTASCDSATVVEAGVYGVS